MSTPTDPPAHDFAGLRDLYDRLAAVASKHGSILVTPDRLCDTAAALRVAEERQKFKDWVHKYLDDHGVPHHPPGTHGAAGCRIGDRLDWVFGMLTGYNKANDLLNKGMESQCERMDELKQDKRRLQAEAEGMRAELDAERKRADDWMKAADRERCPKCKHPWGPIGTPKGIIEDGYQCVWVCPCDCHADVPALRADLAVARAELERVTSRVKDMCPCRCRKAYAGRGLIDPECPWHQYGREILLDEPDPPNTAIAPAAPDKGGGDAPLSTETTT